MKNLIVCFLSIIVSINSFGQSLPTFLYASDFSNEIPKGCTSFEKIVYQMSYDGGAAADSMIISEGDTMFYEISIHDKYVRNGPNSFDIISYDRLGNIESKGKKSFNDNMFITEDIIMYEEDKMTIMNSMKFLTFSNNRMTHLVEKPCDDCDIKSEVTVDYSKGVFPDSINYTNPFVGKLKMVKTLRGDTLKYIRFMEPSQEMIEFAAMMKKNLDEEPLGHEEIIPLNNGNYQFDEYKYSKKDSALQIGSRTVVDANGNILESYSYNNGEIYSKEILTYNDQGKIESMSDGEETFTNEFDQKGNYTKKRSAYSWDYFLYDDNGNWIKTQNAPIGETPSSISIRKIKY